MGVVYTWNDVHKGHIPSLDSFQLVAACIRNRIAGCDAIRSAVLCGSVLRGDHNRRSDIDCVVLYETMHEQSAMQVMQGICEEASTFHVPVNFVPVDSDLSTSTMHLLGRSFAHHIQSAVLAGGMIKGNLLESLSATLSVPDEVRSYIRSKTYNLEEGWASFASFSDERRASFLKKVLESPLHIARKVLHFHNEMDGDSKAEVREKYDGWADSDMRGMFEAVLALDARYSEEVNEQLLKPSQTKYIKSWDTLIEGIPTAVRFARLNALKLSEPNV